MHPYAQTSVQLFNQLQRAGYSNADLMLILKAHDLAVGLFAGRYQPSGKAFMAHVVGTASILASLGRPAYVVAAGLLHNVYWNGDFGDDSRGISPAKRKFIRRAVGAEIERCLAGFARTRWNAQSIPALRERVDLFDPTDRQVVLIKLADRLEKHLDFEILYWPGAEKDATFVQQHGPAMVEMATKLGHPALAAALEQAFREVTTAWIPAVLRSHGGSSVSSVTVPTSYRRRAWPLIRRKLASRLRRRPGAQSRPV